ncbi:MAG: division/cell wall cluster transcriptional repressor MraZ [Cardiobacteriaceae bacterium]|nr:division/cell wall cluster transcriptional repressor MraZ [Cardiobacteriaceae bacterium]
MFRGIHQITLDAKGRLSIPAKLRAFFEEESENKLVMTADIEKNLMIYTLPQWEAVEAKLTKLPSLDKKARQLKRLFMGYASELELDGTGRVLIPSMLREYAGLDKKVTLVGMGNKFELWSAERWESQLAADIDDLLDDGADLDEALGGLSI